jgi:nucleotide-binding universal stress UspA family protein
MKTVLAPIDFSPVTERVVAEAAALARSLDGRLVVMHVTQPQPRLVSENGTVIDYREIDRLNAQAAVRELTRLEDALESEFTACATIQLKGSPVPSILEQAQTLPADYIVVGSHGHTPFHDVVMGSVARSIVRRARCPVIVVPSLPKRAVLRGSPAAPSSPRRWK